MTAAVNWGDPNVAIHQTFAKNPPICPSRAVLIENTEQSTKSLPIPLCLFSFDTIIDFT
jgi:hypothetical protein